uniref:cytochrome P450 2F2-like isoform X3 n=1 Tax=Styela clava TaxID=7725 RepID=UPI0019399DB8|nr:cytochrome P450 2F2-like isoform X3 [Styela clava]
MLISILSILLLVLSLYYLRVFMKDRHLPPGPAGLPIVGYLPFLGRNPAITYLKLSEKYGPVFSIRIGGNTMIILNTREAIFQAFSKQAKFTADRPPHPIFNEMSSGKNISMTNGRRWRIGRTLAMKFLKNFSKQKVEHIIAEESEYLCDALRDTGGKPLENHGILAKAVMNVLSSLMVGGRFSYEGQVGLGKMLSYTSQLSDEYHGDILGILLIAPFLRFLPFIKQSYQKLLAGIAGIEGEMKNIAEDHRQSYDKNHCRDYIDFLLNEEQDDYIRTAQDMIAAGTDTTASTLRWFFLAMIIYPEYQKKLSDEISDVIGSSGKIEMKHQDQMPYTRAFIQEILRYQSPVPLGLPHKTTSEITVQGFKIPPNTTASIHDMHIGPEVQKHGKRI